MGTAVVLTQRRNEIAKYMGKPAQEICDILRPQFPDITIWKVYGDLKIIQAEMAGQLTIEVTPDSVLEEYRANMFKAWADYQNVIDLCPANQPGVVVGAIKGQMGLMNDYVSFLMKMGLVKRTESSLDISRIPQIEDMLGQLQAMPTKQVVGFYAVAFGLLGKEEEDKDNEESIEGEWELLDDNAEG